MDSYTFYAFKSDSSDRDETWPAASAFQFEIDRGQVIECWAKCLAANLAADRNESHFEDITVLKNGRSLGGMMSDNESPLESCDQFQRELEMMEQEAKDRAQLFYTEEKMKLEQAEKELRQRFAEGREQEERRQLASLKKKYEHNA